MEQDHLLPRPGHHDVEELHRRLPIVRPIVVPVDVGQHGDVELQAFAGLAVDDQDAPLIKTDLGPMAAVEGVDGRRVVVQGVSSHGAQSVNISLPDLVVWCEDPDQPLGVAIEEPDDSPADLGKTLWWVVDEPCGNPMALR